MEVIILISVDILFMVLMICLISLDRRLFALKESANRRVESMREQIAAMRREVEELSMHQDELCYSTKSEDATDDETQLKEQMAEKRFTEGIASILAYDFDSAILKGDK